MASGTSLPPELADALRKAYSAYNIAATTRSKERKALAQELANILQTGRVNEWPLSALAEPCGISSQRVLQILTSNATGDPPKDFPEFPRYSPSGQARGRLTPVERRHLTSEEAIQFRALAQEARKTRGSIALDSPIREATVEFSRLLMEYHDAGVVWDELSDATRPFTKWPLEGEEAEIANAINDLRREQQHLRQKRQKLQARITATRAKQRHARAFDAPLSELKHLGRQLEMQEEKMAELVKRQEVEVSQRLDKLLASDPIPPSHRPSGLRMRAARHGYGKGAPPSIPPYRGVYAVATKRPRDDVDRAV